MKAAFLHKLLVRMLSFDIDWPDNFALFNIFLLLPNLLKYFKIFHIKFKT